MQRRLCAAILVLEAVVLGLVTPVLITVAEVPTVLALLLGLGLAVVAVLLAGMLRARWAYALGWCLQVATLALGVLVSSMIVLGVIFLALWATAYFLGAKIERERAEWERTGQYPGLS
jgi:hypothetical protein